MNEQRQRTAPTRERVTTSTYAPVLTLMTTPQYELAPAAVLPKQFYDSASEGRHESGEVALIRAMLDDAIAFLVPDVHATGKLFDWESFTTDHQVTKATKGSCGRA